MRKDTGIPGIPELRVFRALLTTLVFLLTFLLGGAATAANATTALAAHAATKSAGTPPATKPSYDTKEEKTKRESERGQARGTARTSVGVPRHTGGRPQSAYRDGALDASTVSDGRPSAGSSTKAASRPVQLPVLHCVFRC